MKNLASLINVVLTNSLSKSSIFLLSSELSMKVRKLVTQTIKLHFNNQTKLTGSMGTVKNKSVLPTQFRAFSILMAACIQQEHPLE